MKTTMLSPNYSTSTNVYFSEWEIFWNSLLFPLPSSLINILCYFYNTINILFWGWDLEYEQKSDEINSYKIKKKKSPVSTTLARPTSAFHWGKPNVSMTLQDFKMRDSEVERYSPKRESYEETN